ncbi:MAG: GGDEF domain-containing protein [Anaerolineales bacterium]
MKSVKAVITASTQPDPKIQDWFKSADKVCLSAASLIAAIILSGWLMPAIGSLLPDGWMLMQASTAVNVLLLSFSLMLNLQKGNAYLFLASRICAGAAIILAGINILELWTSQGTVIGRLFVADSMLPMTYPMSIQSASCFVLLGLLLLIDHERQDWLGHASDALIMVLVILILVFISGYIFDASRLFGQSSTILISPQTLASIILLTFVQAGRRIPYGFYSVLVGTGIGSHSARIVLPYSVVISWLIIFSGENLAKNTLNLAYAAALTSATMAVLLIILVVLLARMINSLEKQLRDTSLTDELTGIHNRRGFYLLGEQALRDARRSANPVTLLFFDVDDLKKANDTLGHDIGSQLLCDIATLLRANFRDNDIVGRLGGDEFAVLTHGPQNDMSPALRRLKDATKTAKKAGNRPYTISFSVGKVTVEPQNSESLDELLARADTEMYRNKRERQAGRNEVKIEKII